ncbi:MAG: hypothetical protein WAU01_07645 [Saprospiraceae bacterium]
MDRRTFSKDLLDMVTTFALMDSLIAFEVLSPKIKPISDHWAKKLNDYCMDLGKDSISPSEWQFKIEKLFAQIPLEDILKFTDFDKLIKGFNFPDIGVNTKKVIFPKMQGLPENTVFIKKIFGMKKNRAIIPHGHSNMASAHLVLNGELHLRHYEKISQEGNNLIIKPTLDKNIKPGQSSSISDEKENIHWFIANTETAFTFDVIMLDLGGHTYDIHNLDMFEKQDLSDGNMRVPILDVALALKKYGKLTHH